MTVFPRGQGGHRKTTWKINEVQKGEMGAEWMFIGELVKSNEEWT